ncbi:MAG: Xaa-Pro dipeptidase [Kofleriaceae bacterium]|nr:Xaa-Pro dipeptidase [Kofleriaceae bacterium]
MSYAATYPQHLAYLQQAYEAAMATHAFDAIVLCSGAATMKNRFDDQAWPLSPTPAYAHWCPLVEADAYVVVRPGHKPRLVRTVTDDFWEMAAPPESDHFWTGFEVIEVKPGMAGDALPGGRVAVITRDQGTAPAGSVNPPELIAALDQARTKKTAYEVECLVEASRRAVAGHELARTRFATGSPSELALHLAFLEGSEQDEARAPYQNIVALGAHSAVLHYVAYQRARVEGDTSFLIDAGAKVLGYGSDITRTYVRGTGAAATRFRELVEGLDAVQLEIVSRIRPGMPYEDLHDEAHRLIAALLKTLGIGRGSPEELVERGITRALFPHGLGHSLGITVHDAGMKLRPPRPENKFLRNTSVIEPGQVFTIEPGVYVIDGLLAPLQQDARRELLDWSAIDALRPFGGIRIEDNILVEAAGTRNLTREAFAAANR